MNIQIRYFASVREAVGVAQENIALPEQINTVGTVRHFLIRRGGIWADVLGEHRIVQIAYNQKIATPQTPVTDNGEVAFFPPVTGG